MLGLPLWAGCRIYAPGFDRRTGRGVACPIGSRECGVMRPVLRLVTRGRRRVTRRDSGGAVSYIKDHIQI